MAVQFSPSLILPRLNLKELGRISQVCKNWQNVSYNYIQTSCQSLRTEVDDYLKKVDKVFQDQIKQLQNFLEKDEEEKATLNLALDKIKEKIAELLKNEVTETDRAKRWTLEVQRGMLFQKVGQCDQLSLKFKNQMADLTTHNKLLLPKSNPEICNLQNSPGIYVFHLNKKLALLKEIFTFIIPGADREEEAKSLLKVTDLTLSESKCAIKDFAIKKIQNFRRFIDSQLESNEDLKLQFKSFLVIVEVLDKDTTINDHMEILIQRSDDLDTLMSSFIPLRQSFPFLREEPNKQQMIGDVMRPFPKIQLNGSFICGLRIEMDVIDANTHMVVQNGIDEEKKSLRISADWICFPTLYLTDRLNTNTAYKLRIKVGPYSIITDEFKVNLKQ